jgi:hypothetical protein
MLFAEVLESQAYSAARIANHTRKDNFPYIDQSASRSQCPHQLYPSGCI